MVYPQKVIYDKEASAKWTEIFSVYTRGDFDKAIRMYKEFIRAYPSSRLCEAAKYKIQFIKNHSDYNRKPLKMYARAEQLFHEGMRTHLNVEDPDKIKKEYLRQALEEFQRVIREYPESSLVKFAKGHFALCYEGMGEYEQALKIHQKYLKVDPSSYYEIGCVYEKMKQYDKAIEAYRKYLKETPDLSLRDKQFAQSAIEQIHYEQKEFKLLKKQWQKELEKDPKGDNAMYYHIQLSNLYLDEGDYESWIKECDRIIKKFPGTDVAATALCKVGLHYHDIKQDNKKACEYLDRLMREYPDTHWAKLAKEDYEDLKEEIAREKKGKEEEVENAKRKVTEEGKTPEVGTEKLAAVKKIDPLVKRGPQLPVEPEVKHIPEEKINLGDESASEPLLNKKSIATIAIILSIVIIAIAVLIKIRVKQ